MENGQALITLLERPGVRETIAKFSGVKSELLDAPLNEVLELLKTAEDPAPVISVLMGVTGLFMAVTGPMGLILLVQQAKAFLPAVNELVDEVGEEEEEAAAA